MKTINNLSSIVLENIKNSINKFEDCNHYFIIEHPNWDQQGIYYEINYTFENEIIQSGYTEILSMIKEENLTEIIMFLKNQFKIPIYKWKRILVDFE